uniref:ATPEG5 n=1 Tax=Euglena gracilis TaxID=3039 RepID=UPI0012B67D7C|nr:Chain Q, ATPEG5 [Euglena gracilis]6TDU_q Chain q, ATPEG5 [Euglena gracilis]6TDV_Q Chain Q, ATPEG5 [Euglena gracilis]6TDV_q Chain q, ATPEG5 [Euglena gracilis]
MSLPTFFLAPPLTEPFRARHRRKCIEKKDTFFQCLDKNKNETEPCEVEASGYSQECPDSWRRYFNEQRWKALELKGEVKHANLKNTQQHF